MNNVLCIMEEKNPRNRKDGMTLLLTVLIISIILVLGLSIGALTLIEIKLVSTGRESQVAFYAADAGAECALYWDTQKNAFAAPPPVTINCAGSQFSVGGGGIQTFSLSFENDSCARIVVDKTSGTAIESTGTNKCPGGERSIQRGIKVILQKVILQ